MHLNIEKLIYGGDGLARLPADEQGRGKAVFVPFVLESETVEASLLEDRRGFARAKLDQVLQASPQRIDPRCPYFQRCGGCHYQHTSYQHQLQIKMAILQENLRRIAKLELSIELKIHPSPEWNYRNRSRFKVQLAPHFAVGYFQANSRQLLPVEECPISSPLINRALAELWRQGRECKMAEGIQEVECFSNADDTQLLLEIHCGPSAETSALEACATSLRTALPEVLGVGIFQSRPHSPSQAISEPSRIATIGDSHLAYKTARTAYRVSVGAFFQTNRHLASTLIDVAVALASPNRSGNLALDLYAGVGLFSVPLSQSFAQVIAVEASQTSHADLVHNAPLNVKPVRAATEHYLQEAAKKLRPDLVLVDPPRSGLDGSVIRSLISLQPRWITYVSCDPATLARDLAGLLGAGYQVEQAHLLDLFPQTYHIESIFHLAR